MNMTCEIPAFRYHFSRYDEMEKLYKSLTYILPEVITLSCRFTAGNTGIS